MSARWLALALVGDLRGRPVLEELLQQGDVPIRVQAAWGLAMGQGSRGPGSRGAGEHGQ